MNRRHDKGIGHIDTKETEAVFRAEFWALRHDFISKRTTKDELPAGIGESPLFRHMEPSADVPAWWRYAAVGFVVERLAAGEPSETNTTVLADQSPRSRGRRIRWDDVALEAAVAEPAAAQEAARASTDQEAAPAPTKAAAGDSADASTKLLLFNVLIAFEWWPLAGPIEQQIRWLCRNASDFLFDVTDGNAALGTVVLGGPDLMPYADIQVFASNRLYPRCWVGGMFIERKYTPIRVGRGMWHKRRRVCIPWDEPESFRTLVHEWAHYALGLKDDYLDLCEGGLPSAGGMAGHLLDEDELPKPNGAQGPRTMLAVPGASMPINSIMSSTEGSSELTQPGEPGEISDWEMIAQNVPWLDLKPKGENRRRRKLRRTSVEGPRRLPLPLPFVLTQHLPKKGKSLDEPDTQTQAKEAQETAKEEYCYARLTAPIWSRPKRNSANGAGKRKPVLPTPQTDSGDKEPQLLLPIWQNDWEKTRDKVLKQEGPYIREGHCWVYVLREEAGEPRHLIAQGTLEARRGDEGFMLVGAKADDTVILIGGDEADNPTVLTAKLEDLDGKPRVWRDVTPEKFPLVDVYPVEFKLDLNGAPGNQRRESYTICVAVSEPAWRAWVFPLGADPEKRQAVAWGDAYTSPGRGAKSDEIVGLPSLDGYVLLEKEGRMTIANYSIGGTPSNGFPVGPNPISAGSSEGNAMLFFYSEDRAQGYDNTLVVTTLNHGIALPTGYTPRSYTFSIAANEPLPTKKFATLVFYYDRDFQLGEKTLVAMRWGGKAWEEIPTFTSAAQSYSAAPLYGAEEANPRVLRNDRFPPTAPGLFDDKENLAAERYRLCSPKQAGGGPAVEDGD